MKISKNIIFNTIKITLASVVAIVIAMKLGLQYSTAAGIIAILSIQRTKRETINTALGRMLAFVSAMVIAFISFEAVGYNVAGFGIYLIFFIGICLVMGWNSAMAMDSVLITHFLAAGNMAPELIVNELLLFILGVGAGVIANMHLKQDVNTIKQLVEKIDEQMVKILMRMSEKILIEDKSDYNGGCFDKLKDCLYEAKTIALDNMNNQLRNPDMFDMEYVKMRERQCQVLNNMYKNIRFIRTTVAQAGKISVFLRQVAMEYNKDNTVEQLIEDFKLMDESMKNEPLPVERSEFEDRAMLYALLRQLEEFLNIKKEFADKYMEDR